MVARDRTVQEAHAVQDDEHHRECDRSHWPTPSGFDRIKLIDGYSSIDSIAGSKFWWHDIIHLLRNRKANHMFGCACFAQLDEYAHSLE
jgi:hypothetical protein